MHLSGGSAAGKKGGRYSLKGGKEIKNKKRVLKSRSPEGISDSLQMGNRGGKKEGGGGRTCR